jgi:site-specific recombinase XerD
VTQLLRTGIPLHTVSALAGHSQITTTAGYLRVFDEDKTEAVRKLSFRA